MESGHFILHGSGSASEASTLKRNFEFDGISVVRWGEKCIDLHNAYDLETFGTDLTGIEVLLSFTRNEHAINPDKLPSNVTLTCTGNLKVAFNNLGEIAAPLNDEGIEIAYFDAGCEWRSFLDEDIARSHQPQGLHISFINGLAIRIFCDEATIAAR
jgi:hypothetical protein